jgi:hypothetical protein
MNASLNIGKPFGFDVTIHWSFWLVVLWAGSEGLPWSGSWQGLETKPLLLIASPEQLNNPVGPVATDSSRFQVDHPLDVRFAVRVPGAQI